MDLNIAHPVYLKLSVQRGLLGNVSSNLAGLYAKLDSCSISISAYFFEEPTPYDKELIEEIAGEVIGDFTEGYTLQTHFYLISNVMLNTVEWNFLRSEVYAMNQHQDY